MAEKELKPIREVPEDYESIEKEIMRVFRVHIYLPLLAELKRNPEFIQNSKGKLHDALVSGQIHFYRGHFRGRFNATLSRELQRLGATWDPKHGTWRIPQSELPLDVRASVAVSESRFMETTAAIDRKLASVMPAELAENLKLDKLFDTTLWEIEKKFKSSIKGITVAPDLTPDQMNRISSEYVQNVEKYIADFTAKETIALREQVKTAYLSGNRYESLVSTIKKSYGVSQDKAKFLARQETSLMRAKFTQVRYEDIGSQKYKWRCVAGSANHPVRPYHLALNNTTQLWSSPPVVNQNGDRMHPGEDYNCRCTAVAIVVF